MQEQIQSFLDQATPDQIAIINQITGGDPSKLAAFLKNQPKTPKKSTSAKQSTLEPYPIGVVTRCTLCNSHKYETFYMVDGIRGTGIDCLVSSCPIPTPTGFRLNPDTWMRRRVGRCANCKKHLESLSQAQLIEIILGEKVNR
jgi:hypothetical protein